MNKRQAGRLGGKATLARHGREYFRQIGKKGARSTWDRYSWKPINTSQYALVRKSDGKIVAIV